jgi:uncharacterized damage-inducible protein DinB
MSTGITSTEALKMLYGFNYFLLKKNLDGVTHEESLLQPEGGGNCLNWVLGHIVATRDAALKMLNQEPIWNQDQADTYRRGSSPILDGARAEHLEKILADLELSQDRLVAGLANVSESELTAPAGDETMEKQLFTLQLHEAYHAGQTGLLRRMAGHEGAIN